MKMKSRALLGALAGLCLLFLAAVPRAHAQSPFYLAECAPGAPCGSNGPANTGQGDSLVKVGSGYNGDFQLIQTDMSTQGLLFGTGIWPNPFRAALYTDIEALFSSCTPGSPSQYFAPDGGCHTAGGGSSISFQVNGAGASISSTLNFENSAATNGFTLMFLNPSSGNLQLGFSGVLTQAGGGIGATSFAAAGLSTFTGPLTPGHCVEWTSSTGGQGDAGAGCGSGGGTSGTVVAAPQNDIACYAASGTTTTVSGCLPSAIQAQIKTIAPNTSAATSYTYSAPDGNNITQFSATTTVTATMNAGVFPVGYTITNMPTGGETVVFSAGSGVTLCVGGQFNCSATSWGTSGNSDYQTWKQTASNVWTLIDEPPCSGLQECTIAQGQQAMGTASIAANQCAPLIQVSNFYVTSSTTLQVTLSGTPWTVTGYFPAAAGTGHLEVYVTTSTREINFEVCNWTAAAITPGAQSVNYKATIP